MTQSRYIILLLLLVCLTGCKDHKKNPTSLSGDGTIIPVEHATGFSLTDYGDYKIIHVTNPWPQAERSFRYLLAEDSAEIPQGLKYDQKISIPVERMVVTSTTHISSLEVLEEHHSLVGFPGLEYISSEGTRELISEGRIREVGKNEALNTEVLIALQPDVVIAFSMDGGNKTFNSIERSGIPVVLNSDWTEDSPLGKAEWIKFFGAFFNKTGKAANFFDQVADDYEKARELAQKAKSSPTVIAGSMYKDQWYLPYGDSWHARFIEDANAEYLYEETSGSGSMSLAFETVLTRAGNADFWMGPAEFGSYQEMRNASRHYTQFDAFRNRNIYTYSSEKGPTGGVLFYEIAPIRPDLVLKDLISIFHPNLLPEYMTSFYKPLR